MKRSFFSPILFPLLCLLFLISCTNNQDKKAIQLIEKSIVAHGGFNVWEEIQEFSFEKSTVLYGEDGVVESEQLQYLKFRLKPFYEGSIQWERDQVSHVIKFDGLNIKYRMGENEVTNPDFLSAKKRDFDAAFYVMDKPFSLLKNDLTIHYEGMDTLRGGTVVEKIKVIDGDPKDSNVDVWIYYFDAKTYFLVAYQVETKDHISRVYNDTFDFSSCIIFPRKRSSYRVDAKGNELFLRAMYEYNTYKCGY